MAQRKAWSLLVIIFLTASVLAGCAARPASIPGLTGGDVVRKINREYGMTRIGPEPVELPWIRPGFRGYELISYVNLPDDREHAWALVYCMSLSSDRPEARVLELEYSASLNFTATYSSEFFDSAVEYIAQCATISYTGAQPEVARAWVMEVLEGFDRDSGPVTCVIGGVQFRMYCHFDVRGNPEHIDLTLTPCVEQGG